MTEGVVDAVRAPTTAGGLLREARQARGLHIAALAATIKVSQRKLELLESDQISALPDATFARALAQTVCRALKTDPAPVLALLPPPSGYRLEQLGEGLNTPYSDRPGRIASADWTGLGSSTLWVSALLVVAAGVMYLMPANWIERAQAVIGSSAQEDEPAAAVAASAPAVLAAAPAPPVAQPTAMVEAAAPAASVLPSAASAPTGVEAAASAVASTPAVPVAIDTGAGLLQLRTSAPSWIEVRDAHGKILLSRVVASDETLALDGVAPLKLKIGNAADTRLMFRGEPVDLSAFTRDNVARFELK
ncbi:MAG: helix-turn-helix domain-containing protein [Burkholderiaceae bacterium]